MISEKPFENNSIQLIFDEVNLKCIIFNDTILQLQTFTILFQKMVLIFLLHKSLFEYLITEKFPSNLIRVNKKDISKTKETWFINDVNGINLPNSLIDLSKLERLCKLNTF